jgi:hypothetical protein
MMQMPSWFPLLAHGGAVGLAFEIGFLVLPIVVFALLAWWSGKRAKAGEDAGGPKET